MVRVRHYTRVSAMQKILDEQRIVARDQNKVFVERANRKPTPAREVEEKYELLQGKGNAFVEFDVEDDELGRQYNKRFDADESYLTGNVDLVGRNALGYDNF